MATDHAQYQTDKTELRLIENALKDSKSCVCGEPLTNDEIGEDCPGCGRPPEDLKSDMNFMSNLTRGILDPASARSSRAIQ